MDNSIGIEECGEDQSVESRGLRIPPWGLWVGGVFGAATLPWGAWVTYTLLAMQFTALSANDGTAIVTKMEARFDKLDAKVESLTREVDRNWSSKRPNP